ncbi:MAG: hypothetical protein J0L64_03420 [Acidobacteria bacterium]|nr:hypothetical protein [Acidobacteriota bacterium]
MKPLVYLFCLSAACCATVAAQSTPQMSRLYAYEVPSDGAAEFFDVQRDTAEIYKANKAPYPRLCWTSLAGPQMFYMMVPITGLDKLTERTWLSQQGEEMPRNARMSRLSRAGASATIKLTRSVPELSWDDTPGNAPDAFGMVRVDIVKPGKTADYTAMMKDVSQTYKKMGTAKSFYVNRVAFGGNVYEYHSYTGLNSLADIQETDAFRKAMGEAKYDAFIKKLGDVIESSERTLVRFRPEFSYVPEAK